MPAFLAVTFEVHLEIAFPWTVVVSGSKWSKADPGQGALSGS